MSGVEQGTLPPAPSGDTGQFAVDTSGIEFSGGPGGGGRSQRDRIMIGVIIVLVLALVGYLGVKVLHKSGTPAVSTSTTLGTGTTVATGVTTPSGATGAQGASAGTSGGSSATATPHAPFQVYATRDPFVPVALPILTASAALFGNTLTLSTTPITLPTPPVTTPPPTQTIPGTVPATTPTVPGTTPGGGGPPPATESCIQLISVYTSNGQPSANVTVAPFANQSCGAPTGYVVFNGTVFAGNYTVVALDVAAGCGTFLYADYEFQLCAGQQATV